MEYRTLGRSGLKVSSLTMGTMTFGGMSWAKMVGQVGVKEAKRLIDICRDAGVNMLDTADVYSEGMSEEIIGEVFGGKRAHAPRQGQPDAADLSVLAPAQCEGASERGRFVAAEALYLIVASPHPFPSPKIGEG